MSSAGGGGIVPRCNRVVGDYIIGQQIGAGAFSTVWRARHRVRGTEVAVKEIVMDRLSKKLQENLLSEVSILRRINHPNIIALYDFIQTSGRIYLVLEYCKDGDLSVYIQNHGRVPEIIAKHFMQQLASGLQVLRDNNVIHRDLKPQNLLLSTHGGNFVLKIADFGFARSLAPRGLAETLCGSPLYMAPEVMQFQKYDAKADLWSVGIILYQLVTGKTPFTGNSQIQLLQNVLKTNELHFPFDCNLSSECVDLCQKLLRRNAVERLTFEEFFNHQFLLEQPTNATARIKSKIRDDFTQLEYSQKRLSGEISHDDSLPFPLDEESVLQETSIPDPQNKGSVRRTTGFTVGAELNNLSCSPLKDVTIPSRYRGHAQDFRVSPAQIAKETEFVIEQKPSNSSKDSAVVDSLEFVDQDYVIVPGPPLDMSPSSVSPSPTNSPRRSESPPVASSKFNGLSAPLPIIGAVVGNSHTIGTPGSGCSASLTSQGSMDMIDAMEQPSGHFMVRIRSLQQFASVITDIVKEKIANGQHHEAFSVQLLVLAIWKQALRICHAEAASTSDVSPLPEQKIRKNCISNTAEYLNCIDSRVLNPVCSEIERDFLLAVEYAEELASDINQKTAPSELPDAIEIIFQSALTLGRQGGVDEMMGNMERASCQYSKAVSLLRFLLVEAPSLVLSPSFTPTISDRYRLRTYIDALSNRRDQSSFLI
ncbi:serine/threonine-protein kinase ATG1c-like isoform X1 [Zingiber officinale]|uniref:serine/threonine-protein kinase ATG1c-like isoform X1 n=1 Tax=Zingiber officinale TaxID=94328 RepID=UPI001C4BE3FD|nr:serine/threonine-protein kinase ATG1c-like isoform X1 [Zingiber officinale]XP_042427438.1 serine/threonine-protein kinase ATG1c-like isoform X1 [Zingiber officinale]